MAGNIERLKEIEEASHDVIICHNVLEYAEERIDIVKEFARILKPDGILSIVKHNHAGRIMQKVVFENSIDEAISILKGGDAYALSFGKIRYYHTNDVTDWASNLTIEKEYGVRTFWALQQDNSVKELPEWQEKMFQIEKMVCDVDEYRKVSFFNHILLRKCEDTGKGQES